MADTGEETAGSVASVPSGVPVADSGPHIVARDPSMCLVADGVARCWGCSGVWATTDDGRSVCTYDPREVDIPGHVVDVALGAGSGCALTAVGQLFCWGDNGLGALGIQASSSRTPAPADNSIGALKIELGSGGWMDAVTCALAGGGSVACRGPDTHGGLGLGEEASDRCGDGRREVPCSRQWLPVTGLQDVVQVAAGDEGTCAVVATGDVYCWGTPIPGDAFAAARDTCSYATVTACDRTPVKVEGLSDVAEVGLTLGGACARTQAGDVYCWGQNLSGELGQSTDSFPIVPGPMRVDGLPPVTQLDPEHTNVCAVDADHHVWCWGDNTFAQLGSNQSDERDHPTPIMVPLDGDAVQVAQSGADACALTQDGEVWCWGANGSGQLQASRGPNTFLGPTRVVP